MVGARIERRVQEHPVLRDNRYLARFAKGVTLAQARHELQQFSVFAIHFDVAQCQLVANAPTREVYERRLKLLLNEKGIPYANGFEGELTGRWSPSTVHFSWLERMAAGLGLGFADIGKRRVARPGTLAFVEATMKWYGHDDPMTGAGAAFAIEHWAAGALWDPWIAGMERLNATLNEPINIGYLTYHREEERHHAQSTLEDLAELAADPLFDEERFLRGAEGILDEGVAAYYESQLRTMPERDETWPTRA